MNTRIVFTAAKIATILNDAGFRSHTIASLTDGEWAVEFAGMTINVTDWGSVAIQAADNSNVRHAMVYGVLLGAAAALHAA